MYFQVKIELDEARDLGIDADDETVRLPSSPVVSDPEDKRIRSIPKMEDAADDERDTSSTSSSPSTSSSSSDDDDDDDDEEEEEEDGDSGVNGGGIDMDLTKKAASAAAAAVKEAAAAAAAAAAKAKAKPPPPEIKITPSQVSTNRGFAINNMRYVLLRTVQKVSQFLTYTHVTI